MSNLFFQITDIASNVIVFLFAGYYLFRYLRKEKELEKKTEKIDTQYHQIVDNALSKERKILEDATSEADVIITQAQFATQNTQEKVNKALEEIIADVHKETANMARNFINEYEQSVKQIADASLSDLQNITKEIAVANKVLQNVTANIQKEAAQNSQNLSVNYQNSIQQVATQSLANFQGITHALETTLEKQIKDFHNTLLPNLEKEVESYKQERLAQVEQLINHIIQKVAQEALRKTISLEDHKSLIIAALEKAKKEGVFD